MKFVKEGFDVFVLVSFEDKSGCRILNLLQFVKKMLFSLCFFSLRYETQHSIQMNLCYRLKITEIKKSPFLGADC